MDLILSDFIEDLSRVRRLLDFSKQLQALPAIAVPADLPDGAFQQAVAGIHATASVCHGDLKILVGTMVLYLGGRFEFFVRSQFEELCNVLAEKCSSYDNLPREMRSSLIALTAEVMSNPRKYGHADKGVEAFVKNLSANLSDRTKLDQINAACLSITHENMRPDVLKELFERIGAKDVWKSIGEQAPVKVQFETNDSAHAKREAERALNRFMDVRNTIAHPSAGITWPELPVVEEYIRYFEVLSKALSEVVQVFTVSLPPRVSGLDASSAGQAPQQDQRVALDVDVRERITLSFEEATSPGRTDED